MFPLRLALRGRFVAANMTLTVLLVVGFAFAVDYSLKLVRNELVNQHFTRELTASASALRADPSQLPRVPKDFLVYVFRKGNHHGLMRDLEKFTPGVHSDVALNGTRYIVGRQDIGEDSLFLLLKDDLEAVRIVEAELWRIAVTVGGFALLFAIGVALWLARVVLRPVHRLASNVRRIVPGDQSLTLSHSSDDPAIEAIARAFEQVHRRYEEAMERERQFSRDASHELRTPLAVISTSAELLAGDDTLDTRHQLRVGRIRAATAQMRAMVEGLLLLARPLGAGSGRDPSCRASDVAREVLRLHTQDLHGPRVQLGLEVLQDHVVRQSHGLLLCVVGNLVRNALHHSGGSRVFVTLTARGVEVEDNGRGVPVDAREGIFERHVRGGDSAGEGLGLYIAKRICDRAGWRIEVETPASGGTCFVLLFDESTSS